VKRFVILNILILSFILVVSSVVQAKKPLRKNTVFSFIVTADMRGFAGPEYQSSKYFLGTCEAVRKFGKGSFMVSPGDIDPPNHVLDTIKKVLGKDYLWYPVVGNHEAETPEDMAWLRDWGNKNIPNLTRKGPENGRETTYSFDYKNAHFVVINQYYDGKSDTGTDGDIPAPLFDWLADDLVVNSKPFVFVFGHEPFVSIPDFDNGRYRHKGDSLDAHPKNSYRFWKLIRRYGVTAFICGHTHNLSLSKINGVWQLDAGHARGIGDTGAPSTFLKIFVGEKTCWVEVYRDDGDGGAYALTHTTVLD
jgi:hypothetical protein